MHQRILDSAASAAPPVPAVPPLQTLQYSLSPLLRGPAFLPPRSTSFSCSLSVSFAPSPADLPTSSWSINQLHCGINGKSSFCKKGGTRESDTQPLKGPARVPEFLHTHTHKGRPGTRPDGFHISAKKCCTFMNPSPAHFLQKRLFCKRGGPGRPPGAHCGPAMAQHRQAG